MIYKEIIFFLFGLPLILGGSMIMKTNFFFGLILSSIGAIIFTIHFFEIIGKEETKNPFNKKCICDWSKDDEYGFMPNPQCLVHGKKTKEMLKETKKLK